MKFIYANAFFCVTALIYTSFNIDNTFALIGLGIVWVLFILLFIQILILLNNRKNGVL